MRARSAKGRADAATALALTPEGLGRGCTNTRVVRPFYTPGDSGPARRTRTPRVCNKHWRRVLTGPYTPDNNRPIEDNVCACAEAEPMLLPM
jgi:hypothetical protein